MVRRKSKAVQYSQSDTSSSQTSTERDSQTSNERDENEQVIPIIARKGTRVSNRIRAAKTSSMFKVPCNPLEDEKGILADNVAKLDGIITKLKLVRHPGFILCDPNDDEIKTRLKLFEGIDDNIYLNGNCIDKNYTGMNCECIMTKDQFENGVIGCNVGCTNRAASIECDENCLLGSRCNNKGIRNKIYKPVALFKTERKGYGLKALVEIKQSEFIIEYVGEVVDHKEFIKRRDNYNEEKKGNFYFMDYGVHVIDSTLKGNSSRFINHSCDPNCKTEKITVDGQLRIGFFAKRDIEVGEEITYDYEADNLGDFDQKCDCEASECKGKIWKSEPVKKLDRENNKRKNKKGKWSGGEDVSLTKYNEVLNNDKAVKEMTSSSLSAVATVAGEIFLENDKESPILLKDSNPYSHNESFSESSSTLTRTETNISSRSNSDTDERNSNNTKLYKGSVAPAGLRKLSNMETAKKVLFELSPQNQFDQIQPTPRPPKGNTAFLQLTRDELFQAEVDKVTSKPLKNTNKTDKDIGSAANQSEKQIDVDIQPSTSSAVVKVKKVPKYIGEFECPICMHIYKRTYDLDRHMRLHDDNLEVHKCGTCGGEFRHKGDLKHHTKNNCKGKGKPPIKRPPMVLPKRKRQEKIFDLSSTDTDTDTDNNTKVQKGISKTPRVEEKTGASSESYKTNNILMDKDLERWYNFFTNAGIEDEYAHTYAKKFKAHKMLWNMHPICKEDVKSLGISTIGHVILIAKYSELVSNDPDIADIEPTITKQKNGNNEEKGASGGREND